MVHRGGRALPRLALSSRSPTAFRRALLDRRGHGPSVPADDGPGVVVFDEQRPARVDLARGRALDRPDDREPPPAAPADSKMVQAVAARARTLRAGQDPLELAARSRVQTRVGRVAAAVRHAARRRRRRAHRGHHPARRPARGRPAGRAGLRALRTRAPGHPAVHEGPVDQGDRRSLARLAYTVQDHLKSIFDKTGVRSRGELVGQIFLEHYVPRWEKQTDGPTGWLVTSSVAPPPSEDE